MESKTYFKVSFNDPQDKKPITLDVRDISDSNLGLSFVCLSGFMFDNNKVVIDPEEEALRKRFDGVKSLHVSIYSILSVVEMGIENRGLKFKNDKSNVLILNNSPQS